MKKIDKLKILIFKQNLIENKIEHLFQNISDEEILLILNSSLIPNSINQQGIKNSFMSYLLFESETKNREKLLNDFQEIYFFIKNMPKVEKSIIRFFIFNGLKASNNWYVEKKRFENNNIGHFSANSGRKRISNNKFKEVFPSVKRIYFNLLKNKTFTKVFK